MMEFYESPTLDITMFNTEINVGISGEDDLFAGLEDEL